MSNKDLLELNKKIDSCVKEIFFINKEKILNDISNLSEYFREYYLKNATELDYKVIDMGKYKLTHKELDKFNIQRGSNLEYQVNTKLIIRYKNLIEEKVEYCIFKKNGLAEIYIKEEKFKEEKKRDLLLTSLYGIMSIIGVIVSVIMLIFL